MTTDEKLAAILAAVQTDPGNRGLARDPHDNLFTATKGGFEVACRSLANNPPPELLVVTGFFIPSSDPPAFETDGPLGALFLTRALRHLGIESDVETENAVAQAIIAGLRMAGVPERAVIPEPVGWASLRHIHISQRDTSPELEEVEQQVMPAEETKRGTGQFLCVPHQRERLLLSIERAGPATDGRCYTMRGRDITEHMTPVQEPFLATDRPFATVGIGDGGNEIGMGKIPHETIVKNVPNGDLIHCRVPTDHLIVAGVSNWGAYALAAGAYVLRGVKPPSDLFDPSREQQILEVMVREGPLVDGVTGKQTATVDGLTWDEYTKPLVRIREILES